MGRKMIRKYERGDVWRVKAQHEQEDELADVGGGFEQIVAYSLVGDGGDVLAVFGFDKGTNGVGEVYAMIGGEAGRKIVELFRFMKKELRWVMRNYDCKVVRATVKKGFAQGERFVAMLGFCCKGRLAQFYKGNDYLLFEKEEK